MPRVAIAASPSLASFLRQRRQELGMGLRDVQSRSAELGQQIPFSTLAKIEKGTVEPGMVRIELLLELYGVPMAVLDDLLSMEEFAAPDERAEDLERPDIKAREHFKNSELARGLGVIFAARRLYSLDGPNALLRQKVDITFAILLRSQGKYRLAQFILDELQLSNPNPELKQFVLGTAATGDLESGRLELAQARHAAMSRHAGGANQKTMEGLRYKHQSLLAELAGNFSEAIRLAELAIPLHQEAGDAGVVRMLHAIIGRLHFKLGRHAKGLALLEDARASALAAKAPRVVAAYDIMKADCLRHLGRFDEVAALAKPVLDLAKRVKDKPLELEAHHALWKVAEAAGEQHSGRRHLAAALELVGHIDDPSAKYQELRQILADRGNEPASAGSGRGRKRASALVGGLPSKAQKN